MKSLRYRVVVIRPDGRRSILLSSRDRAEAEAWARQHRAFARAAGGDVVVERDGVAQ